MTFNLGATVSTTHLRCVGLAMDINGLVLAFSACVLACYHRARGNRPLIVIGNEVAVGEAPLEGIPRTPGL